MLPNYCVGDLKECAASAADWNDSFGANNTVNTVRLDLVGNDSPRGVALPVTRERREERMLLLLLLAAFPITIAYPPIASFGAIAMMWEIQRLLKY